MARERNCTWHFAQHTGGMEQGPMNAVSQNFKKHPYASIVREAIQNSLDVVQDKAQPVRVEFSFGSLEGRDFPEFFRLKKHIEGCLRYFDDNRKAIELYEPMLDYFSESRRTQEIGYIKISDYNTVGMDYYANGKKGTFYAFMKAAGYNLKSDTGSGGSFGFGKGAYYILSPIRTLMISTMNIRGERCFEGASMLSTHTLPGNDRLKYVSVGYYDDLSAPGEPVTDADKIPVPLRRDEPGTDFFIMGFDMNKREQAREEMIKGVLRHFWMAIWQEKLVVEIDKPKGADQGAVTIDKTTIADLMQTYFPELKDASQNGSSQMNPRPYFEAVYGEGSDASHIHVTKNISFLGNVHLYLHKNKEATDGDKIVYMRSLLMMVDKKKFQSNQSVYGVFVCNDKDGNKILQEMENPAHDEWRPANWEKKGQSEGRAALSAMREFIAQSIEEAFSTGNSDSVRISGLEKYLYSPADLSEPTADDGADNPFSGAPTGEFVPEGTSITTDMTNPPENTTQPQTALTGQVKAVKQGSATEDENGDTKAGAGAGDHQSKEKGGKKHANNNIKTSVTDDSNTEENYMTYVNVKYRLIAQKEGGRYVHYLQIDSPYDVAQGEIVYTLDNDSEYIAPIAELDNGTVVDKETNTIEGIKLNAGLNRMRIVFEECNRKHTIRLDVYEINS